MNPYDLTTPSDAPIPCPGCARPMPAGVVVCTACGYDLQAGRVVKTAVGVEELPPPPVALSPEGGPGVRALMISGGVVLAAAMFAGAYFNWERGVGVALARSVLTAYNAGIYTGTGVVALFLTARLVPTPMGRADLGAARIFAGVCVLLLLLNTRAPMAPALSGTLAIIAAAGGYWVALKLLLRTSFKVAGTLLAMHAGMILLLELGAILAGWAQHSATIGTKTGL